MRLWFAEPPGGCSGWVLWFEEPPGGWIFVMKQLLRWLLGLFLASFLLLAGWKTAVSQTPTFSSSAIPIYGQKVTFRLSGQLTADVEKIELFINPAQSAMPLSVEVSRFTQDDAGRLEAEYDLTPAWAKLQPFAEVRFWWELTTAASQTIVVPEESFTYRDDRFAWRVLSEGDVTVYWTGNDPELGQLVLGIVADSRQMLDRILPPTAVSPLNIYIYPDSNAVRAGLRLAGRVWQNGHTDPDLGVLLLTAVNRNTAAADLGRAIPHELTHLRLYQLAPTSSWPIWYEEGIALLAEGDGVLGRDVLETAVSNDDTLSLLTLCTNFPVAELDNDLALAQSISLLTTIQAQFGSQALRQLGTVYQSGAGCADGLEQTLGISLAELNVDWLRAQEPQPVWLTFLSQNGLWLLLLLGSFGLLALLAKR
jgi:Peptidase MA superfamily